MVNPYLKYISEDLEQPLKEFLRGLHLGVLPEESSDYRYCQRLSVIGWEPIVLRRIISSLCLAYKLVFKLIPCGHQIFSDYIPPSALCASKTRTVAKNLAHPRPIQPVVITIGNVQMKTSARSFAFITSKVWNSLPFPAPAYESLQKFKKCLSFHSWSSNVHVKELMSNYRSFLDFRPDSIPLSNSFLNLSHGSDRHVTSVRRPEIS